MTRIRTILEWAVILVPLAIVAFLVLSFYGGAGLPAAEPSGLPDGSGGFYQAPVSPPQQFSESVGGWQFVFPSSYTYTLAGKIVGRHEYPAAMPDGIIALDLAVVNGELLKPDILSDIQVTMGDHTLEYSYDIPNYTGLTEDYVDTHISNNHLVFLNSSLESAVKSATVGSCVVIKGHLVDIRGSSPAKLYIVNTSTVRNDAYPGGCEIILVESYEPVSCGNER